MNIHIGPTCLSITELQERSSKDKMRNIPKTSTFKSNGTDYKTSPSINNKNNITNSIIAPFFMKPSHSNHRTTSTLPPRHLRYAAQRARQAGALLHTDDSAFVLIDVFEVADVVSEKGHFGGNARLYVESAYV